MAITFQTAYEGLMDMVSRPTSETVVLAAAKREINAAVRIIQRMHAFVMTEKIAALTYTAAAQTVSVTGLSGGAMRDLRSVQQLSASGNYEGKPLAIKSYMQLQADRKRYAGRYPAGSTPSFDQAADFVDCFSIEEGYRSDRIAFTLGGTLLGLYPRPSETTYLELNYNAWLAEMSGTTDTNFLLDFALDVVLMIALGRMHIYLKADSRYGYSREEVKEGLQSLIQWDSQLRETPITTIA